MNRPELQKFNFEQLAVLTVLIDNTLKAIHYNRWLLFLLNTSHYKLITFHTSSNVKYLVLFLLALVCSTVKFQTFYLLFYLHSFLFFPL